MRIACQRALGMLLSVLFLVGAAEAQTIIRAGGGTAGGGGGSSDSILGGSCTNQGVVSIDTSGVPTCVTWTSSFVNNSIALTGVDINTSSQVTATHLSAALPVAQGGTSFGAYTVGDLMQASATGTLVRLNAVATGNALISGGVGTVSSWGKIGLTTHVSGILPTANGGTGIAFFTAAGPTAARVFTFPDAAATVLTTNAAVTPAQGGTGLATLTAHGVLVGEGTSNLAVTTAGTSGQVLTSNGASADPTFQTISGTGTVTSIATSAPLGGGTITTSGTLTCATCVTAGSALTAHGVVIGGGSQTTSITSAGTSGQIFTSNGASADPTWQNVGSGTVTSAAMSVPAFLTVSGSPITTTGTFAVTATSAAQNLALMSPNGSSGAPVMRAIVAADLPSAITETSITSGVTISTYGASYAVNCSSACTIVLPAVGSHAGNSIAFRVLAGSSLVTLDGNASEPFDSASGPTTKIMHGGESSLYMIDLTSAYWQRLSGVAIPFSCVMNNSASQTMTAFTGAKVNLNTVIADNGSMADTTNHYCTIKRPGTYMVIGQVGWANLVADQDILGSTGKNGISVPNRIGQQEFFQSMNAVGVFPKSNFTVITTLAAGDTIELDAQSTSTQDIESVKSVLSILEVPTS